ncbi:hypothetical protein TNCV_1108621 [Trichonephila clavipes]|nr:hypothetical protein TNCV_1108621 [Trichonephila clavipes]
MSELGPGPGPCPQWRPRFVLDSALDSDTGPTAQQSASLTTGPDGRPAQVLSSPIDNSSKLRGPSPIALVQFYDNLVALHFKYDQARRGFVEWAQNEIAVVPDFHKRILFSDEAHFWLNSYVNKQNCRIWSEANPQVYVETLLHPEKLTVWCALWAGGILLQKR